MGIQSFGSCPIPADHPAYAELACRSNFSFLTGASHPEELIARAQALGYSALAVTDECSFAGVVRAHVEAKRLGFKLIIGTQMWLTPAAETRVLQGGGDDEDQALVEAAALPSLPPVALRLVLLVQNEQGYRNLSLWITLARRRAAKGSYVAHAGDVEGRAAGGPMLSGLAGCFALLVIDHEAPPGVVLLAQAPWLRAWFGPNRCALGLVQQGRANDAHQSGTARQLAALTGLRRAALGDVLMHLRSRKARCVTSWPAIWSTTRRCCRD